MRLAAATLVLALSAATAEAQTHGITCADVHKFLGTATKESRDSMRALMTPEQIKMAKSCLRRKPPGWVARRKKATF